MSGHVHPDGPRWRLAEQVSEALCRRWAADVRAVGVHGPLAHDDDPDGTDVDIVVVTYRAGTGPRPGVRRVDGAIVDLAVVGCDEYLDGARSLSTTWPLTADRYLSTRPLYDPAGWYARLRDAHLARLAAAAGGEFATLARDSWCHAESAYAKALRLAEWHDTAGALLTFGAARLSAALVEGLLTRTYFRDSADAVRRTGLADVDLTDLGRKLTDQAAELARRGRPVDGTVGDLLQPA